MSGDFISEAKRELKALRILTEETETGVLAFCLYSETEVPSQIVERFEEFASIPVKTIVLSPKNEDPVEAIGDVPAGSRQCIFFYNVESAFPKFLGYVNFHREELLENGQALVFWIREEGLRRIASEAPDFWAWKSGVFDFRTAVAETQTFPEGPHDSNVGQYSPMELGSQLANYASSKSGDLVANLAAGRRLIALRRFEEAEEKLDRALDISERLNDRRGIAEATLLLGNIKLDQNALYQARSLHERSLLEAEAIQDRAAKVAALRQLSLGAQLSGDLQLAHQLASAALNDASEMQDLPSLAGAYDRLGTVLVSQGDLRQAADVLRRAADLERKLNYRTDLASTLARLGEVYERQGALADAEEALREAAALFAGESAVKGGEQVEKVLQRIRGVY